MVLRARFANGAVLKIASLDRPFDKAGLLLLDRGVAIRSAAACVTGRTNKILVFMLMKIHQSIHAGAKDSIILDIGCPPERFEFFIGSMHWFTPPAAR